MNDESVDPHLVWKMVKMKVREESIKFGASKKKKMTKEQEEIEQSIATLEQKLSDMHSQWIFRRDTRVRRIINLLKGRTDDSRKTKIWIWHLKQRNNN